MSDDSQPAEEDAAHWREAVPVIRDIADEMDDMCGHLPAAAFGTVIMDEMLAKIAEWRDRVGHNPPCPYSQLMSWQACSSPAGQ